MVNSIRELTRRNILPTGCLISKVPVLAEKTVERAGKEEDRQVAVAVLRAAAVGKLRITGTGTPCTDPIADTVGRQRIVIPGKFSELRRTAGQPAGIVLSQSAIT